MPWLKSNPNADKIALLEKKVEAQEKQLQDNKQTIEMLRNRLKELGEVGENYVGKVEPPKPNFKLLETI